ncbi:SpoIIE family protein phosphatase [Streptomyces beijiangensis]|uniref:SpoIIE family protein phosphatase n=1 Tax=Streptomyces beijiangensis TaxID=163361 RepID=A0A939F574_9ACTN|nr:SpoIIE family protein phosphatase [Streptomyces beijiangensis]MBO0512515.1 SpoIIE family protein phosphatase [Streptomyces beijiangensis]
MTVDLRQPTAQTTETPDRFSSVSVLEGSPHGILIASADRGGTAVYANQRLAQLFRTPVPMDPGGIAAAAQLLFDRNGESMAFDDSPMGIALHRRRATRAEVQYRVPGQPPLWLDISASPLECTYGGQPLAVSYIHDVSHQRHSATELDEANQRLAEQLEDLTWVHGLTERLAGRGTLESALARVLEEGALLLHADMGVARLFDEEHGTMATQAVFGLPPDPLDEVHIALEKLTEDRCLMDEVAEAGGALIIEDVATDPSCTEAFRDLARTAGFRSAYAVTLSASDGRRLGVVGWAFKQPGRPTMRQRQLTNTYCRFAGQIVENTQLYERERRIASTLQQSMLAQTLPHIEGVQIAACNLPGAHGMQAGGDWYDVVALRDGKVALALGDVMGKGLGAATAMGQLRTALRAYALVEGEDPVAVLTDLNALTQNMALTDMTTVLYMTVDPAEHRAKVVSAGHPPPLLIDQSGASFVRAGQGVPLGVVDEWHAEEKEVPLPPGALLVLYTDGLVERRGEDLGTGLERLRKAALNAPSEVGELCAYLVEECLDEGANPDDVAILAVRVR